MSSNIWVSLVIYLEIPKITQSGHTDRQLLVIPLVIVASVMTKIVLLYWSLEGIHRYVNLGQSSTDKNFCIQLYSGTRVISMNFQWPLILQKDISLIYSLLT